MDSVELYRQLLGLTAPWTVERVKRNILAPGGPTPQATGPGQADPGVQSASPHARAYHRGAATHLHRIPFVSCLSLNSHKKCVITAQARSGPCGA